jgi:2-polyprenyl-3-methyl-5-hydroxy-6-metoxy-1,4-benzoquinol methylase
MTTTMTQGTDVETAYRGIKIRAGSNLHQEVFQVIVGLGLPPGGAALDVGAGEGAFSSRLLDQGFRVTAIELEPGRFQAPAPCLNLDLNRDFAGSVDQKFDLIVAMEIAEHLRDPRHLISECLGLLKPTGTLIVSSPNVESWLSRIRFLREGRFHWFDEASYHSVGHITPILSWQVAQICREHGAEIARLVNTHNRYLFNKLGDNWLQRLLNKSFFLSALYPLMKGRRDGEVNIYIIKPLSPA